MSINVSRLVLLGNLLEKEGHKIAYGTKDEYIAVFSEDGRKYWGVITVHPRYLEYFRVSWMITPRVLGPRPFPNEVPAYRTEQIIEHLDLTIKQDRENYLCDNAYSLSVQITEALRTHDSSPWKGRPMKLCNVRNDVEKLLKQMERICQDLGPE